MFFLIFESFDCRAGCIGRLSQPLHTSYGKKHVSSNPILARFSVKHIIKEFIAIWSIGFMYFSWHFSIKFNGIFYIYVLYYRFQAFLTSFFTITRNCSAVFRKLMDFFYGIKENKKTAWQRSKQCLISSQQEELNLNIFWDQFFIPWKCFEGPIGVKKFWTHFFKKWE